MKAAREIAESARKVSGTAATDITDAGNVTIEQLLNAGNDAAGNMRTATDNAQQGVRRVGEEAAQGVRLSADEANGLLRSVYGDPREIRLTFAIAFGSEERGGRSVD